MLLRRPVGIEVWPHLMLLLGAGRSLTMGRGPTKRLTLGGIRIPRLRGRVDIRDPARPRAVAGPWRTSTVQHGWRRLLRRGAGTRAGPLRSRGPDGASSLVRLRMDIGGHRCLARWGAIGLATAELLQASLDVGI